MMAPPNYVRDILHSGYTGASGLDEMFDRYLGSGGPNGLSSGAYTPAEEQFPSGGFLGPTGWQTVFPGATTPAKTGSVLESTTAAAGEISPVIWAIGLVALLLIVGRR